MAAWTTLSAGTPQLRNSSSRIGTMMMPPPTPTKPGRETGRQTQAQNQQDDCEREFHQVSSLDGGPGPDAGPIRWMKTAAPMMSSPPAMLAASGRSSQITKPRIRANSTCR